MAKIFVKPEKRSQSARRQLFTSFSPRLTASEDGKEVEASGFHSVTMLKVAAL